MRRRALILAIALPALCAPASALGGVDPVEACIRDNLVRYAPPDRAVVAQYLSLEAACREKVEADEQAAVQTSPIGPAQERAGTGTGAASAPTPAPETQPSAAAGTPGHGGAVEGPAPRAGTGRRSPGGAPTVTMSPLGRPAGTSGPGARAEVLAALQRGDSADPVSPAGVSGGPGWLMGLVIGLVAIIGCAGLVGVRSPPR